MSLKSNIVALKSWLSEQVKETYSEKQQIIIENLVVITKNTEVSKLIPKTKTINKL
ncbi:hypothetical protein [Flavobacterium sp.]|uniref:hypothetical protein n=1 Tax=Flavobacterium sp. TaxID=239 RepID=UPI003791740D